MRRPPQRPSAIASAWYGLARWVFRSFVLPLGLGFLLLHVFRHTAIVRFFIDELAPDWLLPRIIIAYLAGLLLLKIYRELLREAFRQRRRQ